MTFPESRLTSLDTTRMQVHLSYILEIGVISDTNWYLQANNNNRCDWIMCDIQRGSRGGQISIGNEQGNLGLDSIQDPPENMAAVKSQVTLW